MGQVSTEQTVRIIEAVGEAIGDAQVETTIIANDTNYWWLAIIAVLPIIAGVIWGWLKTRKK